MASSDSDVNYLLKKYLGKDVSHYKIAESLRGRGKSDSDIQRILSDFNAERKRVREFAKKVRNKLKSKYESLSLPKQIDKINEYRKKYKFDNIETDKLVDIVFNMRDEQLITKDTPYNEVTRFWGWQPPSVITTGEMKIEQEDAEPFDLILKLFDLTGTLHERVMSQSIDYSGSRPVTRIDFDRSKIDIYNSIHPIIAAMFFPKIPIFENRMLMASFGELAYTLGKQKTNLTNEFNIELFNDINFDTSHNTVFGKKFRPSVDILDRFSLQVELWKSVYALRNGNYSANNVQIDFTYALQKCRDNLSGSAWEMNIKDEGMMMRKLMTAFSLTPTYIQSLPVISVGFNNAQPISTNEMPEFMPVNLITYRIPPKIVGVNDDAPVAKLSDVFDRPQTWWHKNQMYTKKQSILSSNGVLVFYIPRRKQVFDVKQILDPQKFSVLPVSQSRWQNLDKTPVIFDPILPSIGNVAKDFAIESVVAVETRRSDDAIIGSCAMVFPDGADALHYSQFDYDEGNTMNYLKKINITDADKPSFTSKAQTQGTIFIYKAME